MTLGWKGFSGTSTLIFVHLVTSKAQEKHDHLFNKLACWTSIRLTQQSVTKAMYYICEFGQTHKAEAKHEHLFNKPASEVGLLEHPSQT